MDLIQYYNDLNKIAAKLEQDFPNQPVYVTSTFNRDRNSTAGVTLSASYRNAARVITDGTHRIATPAEVAKFIEMQEKNLENSIKAEQRKNKQFVVMVDPAAAGLSNFSPQPQQAASSKAGAEAASAK
jgi:hypothetical protein